MLNRNETNSSNSVSSRAASSHPRLMRLPEVMDRVGLRRSAIYERMREGKFPSSRSLGPRCTVWLEEEIDDWVRRVVMRKDGCSASKDY